MKTPLIFCLEEVGSLASYRPGNGGSEGDRMDNGSDKGNAERSGTGQLQVKGDKKKYDSEKASTNKYVNLDFIC